MKQDYVDQLKIFIIPTFLDQDHSSETGHRPSLNPFVSMNIRQTAEAVLNKFIPYLAKRKLIPDPIETTCQVASTRGHPLFYAINKHQFDTDLPSKFLIYVSVLQRMEGSNLPISKRTRLFRFLFNTEDFEEQNNVRAFFEVVNGGRFYDYDFPSSKMTYIERDFDLFQPVGCKIDVPSFIENWRHAMT